MRKIIFIVASIAVFAVLNFSIYQKEVILDKGEIVYLKLAPVDPRSLMQGDYMRLSYEIEDTSYTGGNEFSGLLVAATGADKVATFRRFHTGEALKSDEKLLKFHNQGSSNIEVQPNSFLFQEGHAKYYENAKYGIFKYDGSENYLLTGLADSLKLELKPLKN